MINPDGAKPIYRQIAEWLENGIINETFQPGDKVYSQYKLAELFNINPATAAKGLTMLAEEGVLYNQRGLGKFVAHDAKTVITDKRKNQTLKKQVEEVAAEAQRLDIDEQALIEMLRTAINERKGDVT